MSIGDKIGFGVAVFINIAVIAGGILAIHTTTDGLPFTRRRKAQKKLAADRLAYESSRRWYKTTVEIEGWPPGYRFDPDDERQPEQLKEAWKTNKKQFRRVKK